MRQIIKPLLGIAVVLGAIVGSDRAALASRPSTEFDRVAQEVSAPENTAQSGLVPSIQVAQFLIFPWGSNSQNRRDNLSREERRCLEKRSSRDRQNCLNNLRNDRRNDRDNDRDNDRKYDRRIDWQQRAREERRCLEKRSSRDRQNCLNNLRNSYRNDRDYDRRTDRLNPFSLQQSYPGRVYRF